MVGCGVDVGDFVFGGGYCVLLNTSAGVCDKCASGMGFLGNWIAVYVATQGKYWAIDKGRGIEN